MARGSLDEVEEQWGCSRNYLDRIAQVHVFSFVGGDAGGEESSEE